MAKTYLDSVKYLIQIEFEIKGVVDRPDVIGAVFGQSEGLLGEDLDLRELQKNGRIGRIEITQNTNMGKTKGFLTVPSSLDMVETSILAASIESVDKVGPFESKFTVKNIEDTRSVKRKEIEERAKNLLRRLVVEQIPDTQNLVEKIRENTRTADIENYGPEKLPAGPDIQSSDSIIVVEGRADVLTLLKNSIKNSVAMGGAKPTQTLIDLCKRKTVTLFVDGDRGGDLNVRKLAELTKIDFVAKAPEGKEVEELERKEIIMALRKKVQLDSFLSSLNGRVENGIMHAPQEQGFRNRMQKRPMIRSRGIGMQRDRMPMHSSFERTPFRQMHHEGFGNNFKPREFQQEIPPMKIPQAVPEAKASAEEETIFKPIMRELKGSLKAKLLDENNNELKQVEVREMINSLKETKGVKAIAFDGIITKRVVDEAKALGIRTIVGVKKGKIENEKEVKVLTINA